MPQAGLKALFEPQLPKSGSRVSHPPTDVPRMLRKYFLQQGYTLADEALEDTLDDSPAMRELVGIDPAECGPLMRQGTVMLATIVTAPKL
jgi:IS5 family transposase